MTQPEVTAQARHHELKCWPEFFEEVVTGRKLFEIRRNDRDFKVGDVLWQREWFFDTGYTGREVRHRISYITDWKQADGYVVMSLSALTAATAAQEAKWRNVLRRFGRHLPHCAFIEGEGCTCGLAELLKGVS